VTRTQQRGTTAARAPRWIDWGAVVPAEAEPSGADEPTVSRAAPRPHTTRQPARVTADSDAGEPAPPRAQTPRPSRSAPRAAPPSEPSPTGSVIQDGGAPPPVRPARVAAASQHVPAAASPPPTADRAIRPGPAPRGREVGRHTEQAGLPAAVTRALERLGANSLVVPPRPAEVPAPLVARPREPGREPIHPPGPITVPLRPIEPVAPRPESRSPSERSMAPQVRIESIEVSIAAPAPPALPVNAAPVPPTSIAWSAPTGRLSRPPTMYGFGQG
jgi:hypothetical protein